MEAEIKNRIIEKAVLIRCFESRLLELFSQGRIFGTVHTCIGQELSAAVAAEYIGPDDYVFSNHRCHGHFIAVTDRVEDLMAEIMGRETGVCGGWGGSQHLCHGRFFSNGIQGGFVPITAGLALSEKIRGTGNIACCFIGEGTLGEGAVYESANLMSTWELPALIILENNRFSQSTPQERTLSGELLDRFRALDIECFDADTWDLDKLYETFGQAAGYCRNRRKPAVLRIQTDRLMAHSKGDDDRPEELLKEYWARDIISIFKEKKPDLYMPMEDRATARINRAVSEAEAASYPTASELPRDNMRKVSYMESHPEDKRRINEIIRDCFMANMEKNPGIVMLGEDILDPYGGAFKVTKGLSSRFPERVLGTTISEYSIAGIGNGLSLGGMLPVCEIMFGDFMTFTLDQLVNHASQFPFMYNHKVNNPLIIRTPMGGGRGYGPTHSQSLEKHFLGIPGVKAIALNRRVDPAVIYDKLFAHLTGPALVFENKKLYSMRLNGKIREGFVSELSDEEYPTVRIRPSKNPDITILCYGGMLELAEETQLKVCDDYGINAEIICPTGLYPMNLQPVYDSVRKTGRLIIIEEGHGFAAWGGEVIAMLNEEDPACLKYVKRVNMPDCSIPCSGNLEKELLPNIDRTVEAVLEAGICKTGRKHEHGYDYDMVIIGGGSAGYETAIYAARMGNRVLLAEKERLGGCCLNTGCIPTKVLYDASLRHRKYGVSFDWKMFKNDLAAKTMELRTGVKSLLDAAGVECLQGEARICGEHTVRIGDREVSADIIILATGSSPVIPAEYRNMDKVVTSEGLWDIDALPASVVIVGGGVIGCEIGSSLSGLGSAVTIIEKADDILPGFGKRETRRLMNRFKKDGAQVLCSAVVDGIEEAGGRVRVSAGGRTIEADLVLWAVGRACADVPVSGLTIEKDERGFIRTDEDYRTNIGSVYCIGDANGRSMLAYSASFQGKRLVKMLSGHSAGTGDPILPLCVFTYPEIAGIGLDEDDCVKRGINYRAGMIPYGAIGYSHAISEKDGYIKILRDTDRDVIVGARIVGHDAVELIHVIQQYIVCELPVDDFAETVMAHPTMSEGIRMAVEASY